MDPITLTKKQAWPLVRRAFPGYTGRKFKVVFTPTVTFSDTNWAGGSRTQYTALRADGLQASIVAPAPWVNPSEGATVELRADTVVLAHSRFCGQDAGITIYAHPANAPKWLTA